MSATTAVLRTETRLFGREPGALFWIVLFPAALLVVLTLVPPFREPDADLGGARVIDLYAPIVVLVSMIMAALAVLPVTLTAYRERGVLRRLRATPVSPTSLLTAQVALHGAAVVAGTGLVLVVGRVALDVPLPAAPAGWALAYLLALLVMLATGALVTAVSGSSRMVGVLGNVVLFPTMFTAGLWLPVQTMPDTLQSIVLWTPMGAGADALYAAQAGDAPSWASLGVMAAWTLVLGVLARRCFRWE